MEEADEEEEEEDDAIVEVSPPEHKETGIDDKDDEHDTWLADCC